MKAATFLIYRNNNTHTFVASDAVPDFFWLPILN